MDSDGGKCGGWSAEYLDRPVFEGSEHTVREAAYTLLRVQVDNGVHDEPMGELCAGFQKMLPKGNLMPRCDVFNCEMLAYHLLALNMAALLTL